MVKRAQLLKDATDFTDHMNGKFVKKEVTSGQSSAKPTNGKKHPFNITEEPSQERKPKVYVPNTPTKSHCKHCDKPGHTADECWRKAGACLPYGSREHRIPECLLLKQNERRPNVPKKQGRLPGRRPCERDGPIGRVHKGRRDSAFCHDLIATGLSSQFAARPRLSLSRPVQAPVAISVLPRETEDEPYTQEDGNDLE
ncbi:hypothetical protein Taro_001064 [Colocasia esculenta]|uniref:CCHC-type domain-containing protein n=1 Tax=Colocasia esculenta TaxID=4460 RepID=A0A843TF33_COLES|nr:hypothetical protein [Colocasia esculenta]